MQMTGNTILITGGGSGIGLALAEEFKKLDNQVLIAGRSAAKLQAAEAKGFKTFTVDLADPATLNDFAERVLKAHPTLNVVIHNAGVMKNENLLKADRPRVAQETFNTNVVAPMLLTDALLPHFFKQKSALIMTVTSGLAYMPLALTPSYSASKAAVHSYTESLRYQLRDTAVQVCELVPPYVATELMGARQANDPNAMPLKDFMGEVMQILKTEPLPKEIMVKRVHAQRFAFANGQEKYDGFFKQFNDMMLAARKAEF